MALASGVFKQVSWKRESVYGTAPAASGFALLRRVQSTIDLQKDVYQSNELRTDFQTNDYRHGVRRVRGSIQGELSPGAYSDQIAVACKRDFTAGASASAVGITIAGTGPTWTVTRGAGSYLTDGFKIGDVIRLSVGTLNASNINKNLLITALTATIATVIVLNATALVTGVKIQKLNINLPATGMATVAMDTMGQNVTTANTRYGTTPTAAPTKGVVAAVNGVLVVGGTAIAVVTSLQFAIAPTLTGDPVVGSNVVPNVFPGRVQVTGQFTAYFQDATMRDLFINETESSLTVAMTSDNTAAADFIVFSMPRIKVGGATKNDGEVGLVQTFPFVALFNNAGGTGISTEQTTIQVQDSAAA